MKKSRKKIVLPRKQWPMNPVTRVKDSGKKFSRAQVKKGFQKSQDEE